MAKVSKVSMSIGRTVNLGNYESLRLEVGVEATVCEGESFRFVLDKIEDSIKADLDKRIKRNVESLRS